MRKTLAYFLKNRLHIIAILSFLLLMITFFYLVDADFVYQYEYYDEYDRLVKIISPENSPFSLLATAAAILSTITVIFEFYFKMRKVNVDQMYALPIKREKIFLSKLIVCYLEVIIPITISFILSFAMISISEHIFNLVYMIPFYFGLVFLSIVLITSFAFIYTRGNTFFDGLVNMLAYTCFLALFVNILIDTFSISYYKFGSSMAFFIYSPISIFTKYMDELFMQEEVSTYIGQFISMGVYVLFGILSFFLFVKLNKEEPSENCTQISKSWFSYKTIIPAYTIAFVIVSAMSFEVLSIVFSAIFTYLMFVLQKRSFKLSKKDFLLILCFIAIGIGLGIVCDNISTYLLREHSAYY